MWLKKISITQVFLNVWGFSVLSTDIVHLHMWKALRDQEMASIFIWLVCTGKWFCIWPFDLTINIIWNKCIRTMAFAITTALVLTIRKKYHGWGTPYCPGKTVSIYQVTRPYKKASSKSINKIWPNMRLSSRLTGVQMLSHLIPISEIKRRYHRWQLCETAKKKGWYSKSCHCELSIC